MIWKLQWWGVLTNDEELRCCHWAETTLMYWLVNGHHSVEQLSVVYCSTCHQARHQFVNHHWLVYHLCCLLKNCHLDWKSIWLVCYLLKIGCSSRRGTATYHWSAWWGSRHLLGPPSSSFSIWIFLVQGILWTIAELTMRGKLSSTTPKISPQAFVTEYLDNVLWMGSLVGHGWWFIWVVWWDNLDGVMWYVRNGKWIGAMSLVQ